MYSMIPCFDNIHFMDLDSSSSKLNMKHYKTTPFTTEGLFFGVELAILLEKKCP